MKKRTQKTYLSACAEAVILVLFVLTDQAVKAFAEKAIPVGQTLPLIEGILHITFLVNTGAAFGLISNGYWFLMGFRVLLSLALLFILIMRRQKFPFFQRICITIILSGAIGNLIDQIFLGYVRDMFEFAFIRFAVFNVADSCITVGIVLLCLQLVIKSVDKAASVRHNKQG